MIKRWLTPLFPSLPYWLPVLLFIGFLGGVIEFWSWDSVKSVVCSIYPEKIRSGMFSSFITMGSFLFTLKSFTLTNLKANLYDDPDYQNYYKLNLKQPGYTYLYAFKNFYRLLFVTIFASFLTSVFQFTIGFIPKPVFYLVCIFSGFYTICLLLFSLYFLRKNMFQWLNSLEEGKYNHL